MHLILYCNIFFIDIIPVKKNIGGVHPEVIYWGLNEVVSKRFTHVLPITIYLLFKSIFPNHTLIMP